MATRRRRGLIVPAPRRRRQAVPAELATALAANHLAVIAQDRMPWFALPDIQIIAAKRPNHSEGDKPG